jgi:surface polysaccharide O-acyltransferase-like enzyme
MDRFTWSHLWFLVYLFTFTVLYLPLFRWLLAHRGRLAGVSVVRLYAPLVPLVLVQTTLRFRWPGVQNLYDDWANFTYYSLFFILGFLLARQPCGRTSSPAMATRGSMGCRCRRDERRLDDTRRHPLARRADAARSHAAPR